ncbi:tetratricopeptide repeat protein, partial [bacterium]|nr:tetratricopeptide repeat protein [bacterium]
MRSTGMAVLAVCVTFCVVGLAAAQIVSGSTQDASVEEILGQIQELEAQVEASPDDIELRIELGNVYYESNMHEQALTQYLAVTALDSTHAGARLNLGTLYTDMGKIDHAV